MQCMHEARPKDAHPVLAPIILEPTLAAHISYPWICVIDEDRPPHRHHTKQKTPEGGVEGKYEDRI